MKKINKKKYKSDTMENETLTRYFENELFKKYIESLDCDEKKILLLAIDHLESSFDLEKSIGFLEFKKTMLN